MCRLAQGMNARVGAAGAAHDDVLSAERGHRLLQVILDAIF